MLHKNQRPQLEYEFSVGDPETHTAWAEMPAPRKASTHPIQIYVMYGDQNHKY